MRIASGNSIGGTGRIRNTIARDNHVRGRRTEATSSLRANAQTISAQNVISGLPVYLGSEFVPEKDCGRG